MADSKVPAADNALRILSHLAAQRGPVPASSIATALDLPRSSVYHLLTVLTERGFALHLPEEKRYGLGIAAFELSTGFSRQEPLSRVGQPLLAGLVDRLGESGHLAVLHGRDVLYIAEERAPRRPRLVTDVGIRGSYRNSRRWPGTHFCRLNPSIVMTAPLSQSYLRLG